MFSRLRARLSDAFQDHRLSTPCSSRENGDPLDSMIPDYSVAGYVGGGGAEQYKAVGRMQVRCLQEHAGLEETDDVLEVGCGIGRIAAPLTQVLRSGTYHGFDIVPHGIEWCRRKITAQHPNFTFSVSDIYNKAYNPKGKHRASEFEFPFRDRSFDLVFLTSVFTHMLSGDVEHYTAEIARVLRPGGRCYCTAYIITDEARRFMQAGQSHRIFRTTPNDPRSWTDNPGVPEAAIGFEDSYLFEVFHKNGLQVQRAIPGEWWKHQYAQDTFVAVKA
jgi:SAM-dependent methyltransferase